MVTQANILFLQDILLPIVVAKQMVGLPKDLQNIVWEYLISFHKILRLPRLRAIKRLVAKSNQDIMDRFVFLQSLYPQHNIISFNVGLHLQNVPTVNMHLLVEAVVGSLRYNISSSGLRWVFLDQGLFTVGEYFKVFRRSLIFRVFTMTFFSL